MRHALPNARIMIHQPSGGAQGQATDIRIQAEEILKLKSQINSLYAKHTGIDLERIGELTKQLIFTVCYTVSYVIVINL